MTTLEEGLVIGSCMMWLISPAILSVIIMGFKMSRRARIGYLILAPVAIPLTVLVLLFVLGIGVVNEDN